MSYLSPRACIRIVNGKPAHGFVQAPPLNFLVAMSAILIVCLMTVGNSAKFGVVAPGWIFIGVLLTTAALGWRREVLLMSNNRSVIIRHAILGMALPGQTRRDAEAPFCDITVRPTGFTRDEYDIELSTHPVDGSSAAEGVILCRRRTTPKKASALAVRLSNLLPNCQTRSLCPQREGNKYVTRTEKQAPQQ